MKGFKFLIFCFLGSFPLFGYLQPTPGGFGLLAEYLYLYPSFDNSFFVIQANSGDPESFLDGERKYNHFGFRNAFRIEGAYAFCRSTFESRVRWAHLDGKRHRKVVGDFLLGTEGWPTETPIFSGVADSAIDIRYNNVEALVGHPLIICCPFELFWRAGVQYGYFRFTEEIRYEIAGTDVNQLRFRGRFWGIGPELVIEAHYELCRLPCIRIPNILSFGILGSGSLLVSESKSEFFRLVDSTPNINVKNEKIWRIVPAWSLRFGLNYLVWIGAARLSIEGGYEVTSFIRGASKLRFIEGATPGLSFDDFTNFDVHGPFANIALTF